MFDSIYNYENKFFVSGQEILGIESLDLSYSNSFNISKYAGSPYGHIELSGPIQQKVSISQFLIHSGGLNIYTGDSPISGSLNYKGNSYGFKSGYLEEYMVNCAVGSVPKVSSNIIVFDFMKTGSNDASGSVSTPEIYIPNQGSISISCDNSSTNRVVGFDYSVRIIRKPIYSIGYNFPKQIVTMPVLEYSASVQIDVDDAFLATSSGFLFQRENKTVSLTVKSKDNSVVLQTLSIPKASLIGESLSSSSNGGIRINLNYVGHS